MYSTARKISLLTAVLSTFNIAGVILYLLTSTALGLSFALNFAIFMILVPSAVINLLMTIALRSICQDLSYEYESTAGKFNQIDKKVNELETQK